MTRIRITVLLLALTVLLAACGRAQALTPDEAAPPAEGAAALSTIEVYDVQVEVGVGSPIPVDVMVAGGWPHLCAQLARASQTIEGSAIHIELLATEAPADCPPDAVGIPFRLAFPLNSVALAPGDYTVTVNGVSTEFSWGQ